MKRTAAFLIGLAALSLSALADPPGRVGRLSLVEGEAAVFVDPEQGWEGARINAPLTSENSVWTEPGARAEVSFGSKALRLGEATQLDIVRLDDESFRAHVARGTVTVRIRFFEKDESFVLTTPEARFHLRSNGRYRIDADPVRGETRLAVFEGSARLESGGGTIAVDTGRGLRVRGGERARYEFEAARTTALDEWAFARDRRLEEREAARYVPQQMTGWEDLDDYGVWRDEPEYGPVWFPTRIEVGWAPYRYGRWTWVRPWGWTWVDDAPWGYAPFHYGRWVYVGNRWGWYPGRHTGRPIWAPALVGWVGEPGWSVTLSTGPASVVGWYPLSPYDSFQPWYPANVTYVTVVNRIVIPPRRDHDRRGDRRDDRRDDRRGDRRDDRHDRRHDNRDRGATVVAREHFGSRRPVQQVLAPVGGEAITAQPVVSGTAVLPSRDEWRSRHAPAAVARKPLAIEAGESREPAALPPSAARPGGIPGSQAARPLGIAPGAPVYPTPPAAAPARAPKPAPAETRVTPKPVETAPAPAEPRPLARQRPAGPAAAPPSAAPSLRARPVEPAATPPAASPTLRARPVEAAPSPASPPSARARPVAPRGEESQAPRATEPASPRGRPESKPAPERPARGSEASGRPAERPPKPADPGSGG